MATYTKLKIEHKKWSKHVHVLCNTYWMEPPDVLSMRYIVRLLLYIVQSANICDFFNKKPEVVHENWNKVVHHWLAQICAQCDVWSMIWLCLRIEYTEDIHQLSNWLPVWNQRSYKESDKVIHPGIYTSLHFLKDTGLRSQAFTISEIRYSTYPIYLTYGL